MKRSMPKIDFFKIPHDWEYRGEGNCHVVLGLPVLKKVVRIRKREKPSSLLQWFFYLFENCISRWYNWNLASETRDLNFHLNVMRPLIGFKYVSEAKQVELSRSQVRKIEEKLDKIRPGFRKNKILHFGRATMFHDFTTLSNCSGSFGDTFSVEIKPKKGWIPFSERNFPKCIFCMNQFKKLQMKKIMKKSDYCPKKMFSGNEAKIKESISDLIKNPQNNLRIFRNSQTVYNENNTVNDFNELLRNIFSSQKPDEENSWDDFLDLLYKSLTTNFENNEDKCDEKLFCKWDRLIQGENIPQGSILQKILNVQMLDAEGTQYYKKLQEKIQVTEWNYVKKLLNWQDSKICIKCVLMKISSDEKFKSELIFAPYLIAAVANDCSLMITFKAIKNEPDECNKNVIKTKNMNFFVNVGVIDLYPKPTSTIKKHDIRNKDLLEIFGKIK